MLVVLATLALFAFPAAATARVAHVNHNQQPSFVPYYATKCPETTVSNLLLWRTRLADDSISCDVSDFKMLCFFFFFFGLMLTINKYKDTTGTIAAICIYEKIEEVKTLFTPVPHNHNTSRSLFPKMGCQKTANFTTVFRTQMTAKIVHRYTISTIGLDSAVFIGYLLFAVSQSCPYGQVLDSSVGCCFNHQ